MPAYMTFVRFFTCNTKNC